MFHGFPEGNSLSRERTWLRELKHIEEAEPQCQPPTWLRRGGAPMEGSACQYQGHLSHGSMKLSSSAVPHLAAAAFLRDGETNQWPYPIVDRAPLVIGRRRTSGIDNCFLRPLPSKRRLARIDENFVSTTTRRPSCGVSNTISVTIRGRMLASPLDAEETREFTSRVSLVPQRTRRASPNGVLRWRLSGQFLEICSQLLSK